MTDMGGEPVILRRAGDADAHALKRVAERDSSAAPDAPVLVALVGDEVRAAMSLRDGRTIADPFHPTAELVDLLRLRSGQLRRRRSEPRRRRLPRAKLGPIAVRVRPSAG